MLSIRLFRGGKKHQPSYKIVVVDKKRAPKGGRFAAELGYLNPITKEKSLDKEKAKKWLSYGAQPSDTVYNLFVKEGIIEGSKRDVHKKSKNPPKADQPEAGKEDKTEAPVEVKENSEPSASAKATADKKAEEPKAEEPKDTSLEEEKKEESPKEGGGSSSDAKAMADKEEVKKEEVKNEKTGA